METLILNATEERAELKREIIESAERLARYSDVMKGAKRMSNLETNANSIEKYLESRVGGKWCSAADFRVEVPLVGYDPYHSVESALISLLKDGRIQQCGLFYSIS